MTINAKHAKTCLTPPEGRPVDETGTWQRLAGDFLRQQRAAEHLLEQIEMRFDDAGVTI
jgi:hypothetical protein